MSFKNYVPIKEGDTVIFYLNTSGFPLMSDVWNQMWTHAKELQPNAIEKMNFIQQNKEKIPNVEFPVPPYSILTNKSLSNSEKLEKIQNFIDKLQYNHTGLQFFEIRKDRPLMGLAELSKKIIEDSLPIKCLEAVILSIYFINEIVSSNSASGVEKFSIGFKTSSKGNIHRHVVLGVYCHSTGLFGALGISRRSDLGYKQLKYKSLTDLIQDYIRSYSNYLHKVKRIKIGMPIQNSNRSFETIPWNGCNININQLEPSEWLKQVEKHSRAIKHHNTTHTFNKSLSLSLKNIVNTNLTNRKGNSYLNKHLDELEKKDRARSKSLDKSLFQCVQDEDDEINDKIEEDSDKENSKTNDSYSRTAESAITRISLLSDFSKKPVNLKSQITNLDSYSAGIVKRKPNSLRV